MKLNDYLITRGVTTKRFAKLVGVSDSAVSKWRARARKQPRSKYIKKINFLTKGHVGWKDWY